VPTLYGQQFAASGPMLLALGVAGALLTAGGPVSAFTLGRLSSRQLLTANAVALTADVGLAVALIPTLGGWGAVIANVTGAVTRLALLTRSEITALGLSWRRVANQAMPALVAMPIAVVMWSVGTSLPWSGLSAALVVALCGLCLLTAALRLTGSGLTNEDASVLAGSLPGRASRMVRPILRVLSFARD
jgi:O-antigen/teichoic acid export membrane protein